MLGLIFIAVNCALAKGAEDKLGLCQIKMAELGMVGMQCRQKRFDFYITILDAFNWCLGFHIATSCISIIWSLKLSGWRRITSLMAALRRRDKSTHLIEAKGEDFLFLFDLVAHTCGPPATLEPQALWLAKDNKSYGGIEATRQEHTSDRSQG